MSLPNDDIEAKKTLMIMDKEDIVDRHMYKSAKYVKRTIISFFMGIVIGMIGLWVFWL